MQATQTPSPSTRLQQWFETERTTRGLVDVKFYAVGVSEVTSDDLAQEIMAMNEAIAAKKYTPISAKL